MWSENTIETLVKMVDNKKKQYLHMGEKDPRPRRKYSNYLAVLSVTKALSMSIKQYENKLRRIETHVQKPRKPKVNR